MRFLIAAGVACWPCCSLTLSLPPAVTTTTTPARPTATGGEDRRVSGEVNVTGSSTVEPISIAVAELFQAENPDADGERRRSRHRRRLRALLRRRDRHHRRLPRRSTRRRSAACEDAGIEFVELKVAYRRPLGADQPRQRRRRVPDLRRPLRPRRARVQGLRQLERRQALATELGLDHRAARRRRSTSRPRRGVRAPTTRFIELALGDIAEEREARITEDQPTAGPTTRRRPTTT